MNLLEWLCANACIFVPLGLGFILIVWIGFSIWREDMKNWTPKPRTDEKEPRK